MAGIFKQAVLTKKGIALLAKAHTDNTAIVITKAVTGNGTYADGEDIESRTALKSQKQEFAPTTIARQNDTNVFVRFTITNNPEGGALTSGYYVTEVGLYANDPDEGNILYAIAIGETGQCDYLPAYNDLLPATIMVDFLIEVANSENVTIVAEFDAYASKADLDAKADGIAFDPDASELQLKSNNRVISRCVITLASEVSDEIEDLQQDMAAVILALSVLNKGAVDGTSGNTVVEIFDSTSGYIVVSGFYDSENRRLYA